MMASTSFLNELLSSLPSKPEEVVIVNDNARIQLSPVPREEECDSSSSSLTVAMEQKRLRADDRWCQSPGPINDQKKSFSERPSPSSSSSSSSSTVTRSSSNHFQDCSSSVPCSSSFGSGGLLPMPPFRLPSEDDEEEKSSRSEASNSSFGNLGMLRWSPACVSARKRNQRNTTTRRRRRVKKEEVTPKQEGGPPCVQRHNIGAE